MENISFKHSGRLGDIVYALPLIRAMTKRQNCKADFYVLNDEFYEVKGAAYHPGQGVTVSEPLFDYIFPLLNAIEYIEKVIYCSSNEVPADTVDLDSFKKQKLNLLASGNQVWYRKVHSIPVPIEEKWIEWKFGVQLPEVPAFDVLVSKSTRYYNKAINYEFLDEIGKVGFVGLDFEFEDFRRRNNLKNIVHVPTSNALELAALQLQSKLFVGNQSFGFAIAEGLKVARAIEVYEPVPVVIPIGGICIEFVRTDQIIKFINDEIGMAISGNYPDKNMGFVDCVLTEKPPTLSRRLKNLIRRLRGRPEIR